MWVLSQNTHLILMSFLWLLFDIEIFIQDCSDQSKQH